MLDAYIIDQIRKRHERREPDLQPLRIEVPRSPMDEQGRQGNDERRKRENENGRGVVIIDYSI